jgi:hypothetical protein
VAPLLRGIAAVSSATDGGENISSSNSDSYDAG